MATTADYGLGEFTFPRGWFMVADVAELGDAPLSLRYFGRDFELERRAGRVHLRDATRDWLTVERMGAIFTWHDPELGEPDYDVPLLTEWDDPAWVRWEFDHLGILHSHPQEVLDNIVDYAHQAPIHGQDLKYFELEYRGHQVFHREGGVNRTLADSSALLCLDAAYHGPGILLSAMHGRYPTYFLITHTPVDDGSIKVWHALLMRSAHDVAGPDDIAMARAYQAASRVAFEQDFEIWSNKRPAIDILQLPTDGPFHKGRQWYRQFFNPRARAREYLRGLEGKHGVRGVPRHV
jgi:3-ketosteroid 9alpha-monooxygenase subunit A